ncbi:MAG: rhomboid family intramembrane serine protease [Legionella sp.]
MIDTLTASLNLIIMQTQNNLAILGVILLIPWSIFFISRIINALLLLGIIPRQVRGIPGILLAPLLHAHFNHLFFNSIPLLVLSNFILINGVTYYVTVTLLITVISGAAIWCFAKPGLYIGASALITGYWGLLLSNSYQQPTVTTLILGLLSLYYFAGIFLGIFPGKKGVAWQGHLFGLLAGLLTGYILTQFPMLA